MSTANTGRETVAGRGVSSPGRPTVRITPKLVSCQVGFVLWWEGSRGSRPRKREEAQGRGVLSCSVQLGREHVRLFPKDSTTRRLNEPVACFTFAPRDNSAHVHSVYAIPQFSYHLRAFCFPTIPNVHCSSSRAERDRRSENCRTSFGSRGHFSPKVHDACSLPH